MTSPSTNKSKIKFVSRKWLTMRQIRQQACIDVFQTNNARFDKAYFDSLDKKRVEYDRQFWKVGITQITIAGFLLLSLLDLKGLHFSILGITADAIGNAREFLLFCHALTIGIAIVLQQYIHKLEDFLVAHSRNEFGDETSDNDELKIYVLQFLSPIEAFNINFLPYRKNLFYNGASKLIDRIHTVFRLITFIGLALFAISVPVVAAAAIWNHPNFGWLSYCIVLYWSAVGIFSIASSLINVFPLPYADYSYVTKLTELQKRNPKRHRQIHEEIARTGKLPEI
jgi:hypothetical protein